MVRFIYREIWGHAHTCICIRSVYSINIRNCHQCKTAKGPFWKAESQKYKVINDDGFY